MMASPVLTKWRPAERAYGVRARLRYFRRQARSSRDLLRWVPPSWFVDPLALADLTSPWERAWLTRYLATEFDGNGAVVELGSWLGSATLAMVDGLDRNDLAARTEVHTYDLFHDDDIEARLAQLPVRDRFRDGESFLPQFLERLGSRSARVVVHEGDVTDEEWPRGTPIHFLFNDLSKTWDIWNHVKAKFYRELGVGAVVVEQDWGHACTPWIHLWHFRHRDVLVPTGHIAHSASVVFRLEGELPASALDSDAFDDYPEDEVTEAFEWAIGLAAPVHQADVRGAFVHLYSLYGDLDHASRLCIDQLAEAPHGELLEVTLPELSRRLAERDRRSNAHIERIEVADGTT